MKGEKNLFLAALFLILTALACASQPKTSVLLKDLPDIPPAVQEVFTKKGLSDYFLLRDEGFSLRLIYLCANRVYNFTHEPGKNPVLVSHQPLLDTPVEQKLSAEDRKRIWACREEKVREEHFRVEERKKSILKERKGFEEELAAALKERDRIEAEIALKKKLAEQRQRRIEEEKRKAEEERLRRVEEEQRRKIEEERKVKAYKAGEKEKEKEAALPPPPPKVRESGIFLIMKNADVYETAQNTAKIIDAVKKYDIFEVINSQKDKSGMMWHQFVLSERNISKKGKKVGWTPEEKAFWVKHKLSAWVYPGDLAKISTLKPLKLNAEEIQFTGKKAFSSSQSQFYEVHYEETIEYVEKIIGWVAEEDGIRRADKTMDEMIDLLQKLAMTRWPIKIQNDVLRGFIRAGFTPEQVRLSWGNPDHINTTKTLMRIHQQWVYGEKPFPKAYVYFENGFVKNWEFLKKRASPN